MTSFGTFEKIGGKGKPNKSGKANRGEADGGNYGKRGHKNFEIPRHKRTAEAQGTVGQGGGGAVGGNKVRQTKKDGGMCGIDGTGAANEGARRAKVTRVSCPQARRS